MSRQVGPIIVVASSDKHIQGFGSMSKFHIHQYPRRFGCKNALNKRSCSGLTIATD
jgi:hypothetical protein